MKKLLLLLVAGAVITNANAQTPIEKNVGVIGKVTANWCPPCGSWGWTLSKEMLTAHSDDAVGLNMYASTRTDGGNDKFQNQAAYDLKNKITIGGYPSFSFNLMDVSAQNTSGGVNTVGIKNDVNDSVNVFKAAPVIASTGMTFRIHNDVVTVETKTKFWQAANGTYNVAVYLIEDKALNVQASLSGTVEHPNVLRTSMTASTWGEQIATGSITQGDEFTKTFTFDLTSSITPNYADQPSTWDKTKLVPFAVIYKSEGLNSYSYVNGSRRYEYPASVNDLGFVQNATIYPNPATTQTTVAFEAQENTTASVTVVDATGRTVYQAQDLKVTPGRFFHTINTYNMANGLYNVTIATDNGVSTQRLSIVK